MRSDGTVIIKQIGGANSDKSLITGSELIRDLNKKGVGERTVTISVGEAGSGNSATSDDKTPVGKTDWTNATNSKWANASIRFDPTANPSFLTKDAKTGIVREQVDQKK